MAPVSCTITTMVSAALRYYPVQSTADIALFAQTGPRPLCWRSASEFAVGPEQWLRSQLLSSDHRELCATAPTSCTSLVIRCDRHLAKRAARSSRRCRCVCRRRPSKCQSGHQEFDIAPALPSLIWRRPIRAVTPEFISSDRAFGRSGRERACRSGAMKIQSV